LIAGASGVPPAGGTFTAPIRHDRIGENILSPISA
jgi:hypothetical protein